MSEALSYAAVNSSLLHYNTVLKFYT